MGVYGQVPNIVGQAVIEQVGTHIRYNLVGFYLQVSLFIANLADHSLVQLQINMQGLPVRWLQITRAVLQRQAVGQAAVDNGDNSAVQGISQPHK